MPLSLNLTHRGHASCTSHPYLSLCVSQVSDAHFSLLLSYLEGLQGVAREITVQKAEAFVRFGVGPEGEEGGATEGQRKMQRAREVIQILS